MNRKAVLMLAILLFAWGSMSGQILRQWGESKSKNPLVVTMAVPHLDAEPQYLSLEGRNLGANAEVFIGSLAGNMESLAILSSSENSLEVQLPDTEPGTYLLVVSSGEADDQQMFALYVSLTPPLDVAEVRGERSTAAERSRGLKQGSDSLVAGLARSSGAKADRPGGSSEAKEVATTSAVGGATSDTMAGSVSLVVTPQWETNGTSLYYNGGSVGVGTSTPGGKNYTGLIPKFEVRSDDHAGMAFGSPTGRAQNFAFVSGTDDLWHFSSRGTYDVPNNRLSFFALGPGGAGEVLTLTQSGNLGLGTNNPGGRNYSGLIPKLEVRAPGHVGMAFASGASNAQNFAFVAGTDDLWQISSRGKYDAPNNRLSFLAVGTGGAGEVLTLTQGGNLGVGTAGPTAKLHVNGNLKVTGNIVSDGELCIGSGC